MLSVLRRSMAGEVRPEIAESCAPDEYSYARGELLRVALGVCGTMRRALCVEEGAASEVSPRPRP